MPRPPRICSCGRVVSFGAICPCRQARKAAADKARPNFRQRGYTGKWDKARAAFLLDHPTCQCGKAASHVDHVIAHNGDQRLFWNKANWRSLCASCHSRKTAAKDGGFGNAVRPGRL
jgi:5-methylcytosine-specific restriction enzyme A